MDRDDLIAYLSETMANSRRKAPSLKNPEADKAYDTIENTYNPEGFYNTWGALDDSSQNIPYKDWDRANDMEQSIRRRNSMEYRGPARRRYSVDEPREEGAADESAFPTSDMGAANFTKLYPLLQEMITARYEPNNAWRYKGKQYAGERYAYNKGIPVMLDEVVKQTQAGNYNPEAANKLLEMFRKARPNQAGRFPPTKLGY